MATKYKETNDVLLEIGEDGELNKVHKDVKILTKHEERHFNKGEFYMRTFSLEQLILDRDYSGITFRVMTWLLLNLDYNNRIKTFRQSTLAQRLGSSQPRVSAVLKELEKDGIIYKRDDDYYFNDDYVKGAGDSKKTATKKKTEPQ